MPRGPVVYTLPPGTTPQLPNTVIPSATFNAAMDDIATTFNTAQPIAYGGTGATTAITAWDALASQGTDVLSAGTINLTAATGPLIDITGTTAISTVTLAAGAIRVARATGAFRLVASSTLIVRGSTTQSYTTTNRDLLIFRGYSSSVVAVDVISNAAGANPYPPGTLYGLTLSNNGSDATNDIDIALGSARDSTDAANIDLAGALTKQLDAVWAVGTNAGMLATGVAIANTTYHIFLIKRPDTGVVDIAADSSASGANIAANTNAAYTLKRRIGSIVRASNAIKGFVQDGDDFMWKSPSADVGAGNATNPGTSAVTRTLIVPNGIRVKIKVFVGFSASAQTDMPGGVYLTDLSQTDDGANVIQYATIAGFDGTTKVANIGSTAEIWSNTSGQIRSRLQISSTNTILYISTLGWKDTRGRT